MEVRPAVGTDRAMGVVQTSLAVPTVRVADGRSRGLMLLHWQGWHGFLGSAPGHGRPK